MMIQVGLTHFLVVSSLLLAAGLSSMMIKRNAVGILIGVELVLNAANINLVAFNRYNVMGGLDGQLFAIFMIVLAAAEAAVFLGIALNFYNALATIDVDKAERLKG